MVKADHDIQNSHYSDIAWFLTAMNYEKTCQGHCQSYGKQSNKVYDKHSCTVLIFMQTLFN